MKIVICGILGKMGTLTHTYARKLGITVLAGIDTIDTTLLDTPVYDSLNKLNCSFDCIVDFSHHNLTENLVSYSLTYAIPLLICTTGQTDYELKLISDASCLAPIKLVRNTLSGMSIFSKLVHSADELLNSSFDCELIETHHKHKTDAPSGTAITLSENIHRPCNIHSLRVGGVVGQHSVVFCNNYELITLSHTALNRDAFACGALNLAVDLVNSTKTTTNTK
ncbi:MAG: dihydrodipicolinate reductase C-terminal domain-containing protein [Clostridia bacterium]